LKTQKPFIVFSTYNNSIHHLEKYAEDFVVYDQSDKLEWQKANKEYECIQKENIGHSLGNIFEYILTNWDRLPPKIAFLKANVFPRHCDREYFESKINNSHFTQFYFEKEVELKSNVNSVPFPGFYIEVNNSWYMTKSNHHLFCSFNDLADAIFIDYQVSENVLFGPGACFLLTSDQIKKHPKELYETLRLVVSYKFFPDEAYIVERMIPMIFLSGYECKPKLGDLLVSLHGKLGDNHLCNLSGKPKIFKRIRKKIRG
jgi:hypothetical protein